MADDKDAYSDKPVSPGSATDPRIDRRSGQPTPDVENPPARESWPGGAGTPEQQAAARGGKAKG